MNGKNKENPFSKQGTTLAELSRFVERPIRSRASIPLGVDVNTVFNRMRISDPGTWEALTHALEQAKQEYIETTDFLIEEIERRLEQLTESAHA